MAEFLLPIMALGGMISGGYSATMQQKSINDSLCQIVASMKQATANFDGDMTVYEEIYSDNLYQIQQSQNQVALALKNIKTNMTVFKKQYLFTLLTGIFVLIVLIFIFATKKIILKAHT